MGYNCEREEQRGYKCRLDSAAAHGHEQSRDPEQYAQRSQLKNPYGDGQAANRIREILERDLVTS